MIDFVHCNACRLPSSPSGRRIRFEGVEYHGEKASAVCRQVTAVRRAAQSDAPLSVAQFRAMVEVKR